MKLLNTATPPAVEEDDAELFKLDAWINEHSAKSMVAKIMHRTDEAAVLDVLVKQAHGYSGRLRTLRAIRAEERNNR
jgi:hypothetical protein